MGRKIWYKSENIPHTRQAAQQVTSANARAFRSIFFQIPRTNISSTPNARATLLDQELEIESI